MLNKENLPEIQKFIRDCYKKFKELPYDERNQTSREGWILFINVRCLLESFGMDKEKAFNIAWHTYDIPIWFTYKYDRLKETIIGMNEDVVAMHSREEYFG